MKNKLNLIWVFILAFGVTSWAQNEPDKQPTDAPDVFEQLEEVVVTAGGITREKRP